jgi:hypothetical protein
MRFIARSGLVALSVSFLAGCGAPGGETSEANVVGTTAALTPDPTMPDPYSAPVTLHNYQTGRCLGVRAGTPNPGNNLIVWTCDTSANQKWQMTNFSYNYRLKNFVADDRYLSIAGSQPANGNTAIIDVLNNGNQSKEFWTMYFVGPDLNSHNCYYISSGWGNADQVVGVAGGRTDNGAPVITWAGFFTNFQGHPDQLWCAY